MLSWCCQFRANGGTLKNILDILRAELDDSQFEAATDNSSEILCLACAGSGKSTTLAYRIARLLAEGKNPKSILAFTFTEKAAEAIKLRVSQALNRIDYPPTVIGAMYIGTIHSYCQYILTQIDALYQQFEVLDDNRLKLFLISRYSQLNIAELRRHRNARYFETINQVSAAWKLSNEEMLNLEDIEEENSVLYNILVNLRSEMTNSRFIDFSLMIRLVVDALKNHDRNIERVLAPLRYLMVDEYQDVNPLQEALIQEIHARSASLFVVGDDDQSIYAWRGSDVRNILNFEERYPNCKTFILSHNYRSTPAIVNAAEAFAAAELGATRFQKNPTADDYDRPRDFRVLWFDTRHEEANYVAAQIDFLLGKLYTERNGNRRGLTPSDFAILMRSTRYPEGDGNPRHAAFTQALYSRNIPYSLEAGGSIFDRAQVGILHFAFELLRNHSPTREEAEDFFNNSIIPIFQNASFDDFAFILADWGRRIHGPITGARRRVYPQQLVYDLLNAFKISDCNFDDPTMQDIGVFSKIIQDVETVYMSVDSVNRYQELLNFLSNIAENGYDTSTLDFLLRPDAVSVSTVHKMKGLEFPVVFIVDAENQRFPTRRKSYKGWLPASVIQQAITRGAYQGTLEEETRLFYTAITRAERFLYISGSENLPGGAQQRKQSRFALRLNNQEILTEPLPQVGGMVNHSKIRRIDEKIVPTSYSDIRYYLCCPKDYQFRKCYGFSPPIDEMFGFGITVHSAIGKLHEQYDKGVPTTEAAESIARDTFHLKHVAPSSEPETRPGPFERAQESASRIAGTYVESYANDDFNRKRQIEVRFEIPVENAVIAGSIDLLLEEDDNGRILNASVIDFKVLEGGENQTGDGDFEWTELALQVQLYAKAAREVLGENAKTGAVHLLKDNNRIYIPVTDEAISAAVGNVEWVVGRILDGDGDFPMRPHRDKCRHCDFNKICCKTPQGFKTSSLPDPIHVPSSDHPVMALAFTMFEDAR